MFLTRNAEVDVGGHLLRASMIFVGWIAVISPAWSDEDHATKLKICSSIVDPVGRLACFDKPSASISPAREPSTPSSSPPAQAANGPAATKDGYSVPDDRIGWTNNESRSNLDGSKTVVALLPADSVKTTSVVITDRPKRALLVVRCEEGKTEFYIGYSETVAGMEHSIPVSYRIGSSEVKRGRWGISQNYRGYGTWQSPTTIPLLKSMVDADELYVRGDAGPAGTSEASFKLKGMAAAIEPVRTACRW